MIFLTGSAHPQGELKIVCTWCVLSLMFFSYSFCRIEDVANGLIQLIEDDSQDGAVLTVTLKDGLKYAFV